jgi:hypothetical protein
LSPQAWTTEAALALAGSDPEPMLRAALAELRRPLDPVPGDPALRKEFRDALGVRLTTIGKKIMPTMTADQCKDWCSAVTDALTDLPAMLVLTATKRALRTPMNFLSQVDGEIRRLATVIQNERTMGAYRITTMLEVLAAPTPAEVAAEEPVEFTDEEIRRMSPDMRALGLGCGALTQEMIDQAVTSGEQAAAA